MFIYFILIKLMENQQEENDGKIGEILITDDNNNKQ